jgi:hypothetical protein
VPWLWKNEKVLRKPAKYTLQSKAIHGIKTAKGFIYISPVKKPVKAIF